MNDWFLFQLVVDAALFAIIIIYVLREGKNRAAAQTLETPEPVISGPDPEQINALMDELAKLVMRAEKVADRIERAVNKSNENGATQSERRKSAPAAPAATIAMEQTQPAGSPELLTEEPYVKAAKLIKKGLADDEIGRKVGLPPHEVSLIRRMAN
ncbi:MAG: hypothetical protein HZB29_12550 [Nitrospinae bacterium]|nr:hypothetical protein [Nitrospinota bacterium]